MDASEKPLLEYAAPPSSQLENLLRHLLAAVACNTCTLFVCWLASYLLIRFFQFKTGVAHLSETPDAGFYEQAGSDAPGIIATVSSIAWFVIFTRTGFRKGIGVAFIPLIFIWVLEGLTFIFMMAHNRIWAHF